MLNNKNPQKQQNPELISHGSSVTYRSAPNLTRNSSMHAGDQINLDFHDPEFYADAQIKNEFNNPKFVIHLLRNAKERMLGIIRQNKVSFADAITGHTYLNDKNFKKIWYELLPRKVSDEIYQSLEELPVELSENDSPQLHSNEEIKIIFNRPAVVIRYLLSQGESREWIAKLIKAQPEMFAEAIINYPKAKFDIVYTTLLPKCLKPLIKVKLVKVNKKEIHPESQRDNVIRPKPRKSKRGSFNASIGGPSPTQIITEFTSTIFKRTRRDDAWRSPSSLSMPDSNAAGPGYSPRSVRSLA